MKEGVRNERETGGGGRRRSKKEIAGAVECKSGENRRKIVDDEEGEPG